MLRRYLRSRTNAARDLAGAIGAAMVAGWLLIAAYPARASDCPPGGYSDCMNAAQTAENPLTPLIGSILGAVAGLGPSAVGKFLGDLFGDREVGDPSGVPNTRPVDPAGSSTVLSGQNALDTLARSGLVEKSYNPVTGAARYRPATGFDGLNGSTVNRRVGEVLDGNGNIVQSQDQPVKVNGSAVQLDADGFISNVAITVQTGPAGGSGTPGGWDNWIPPDRAVQNIRDAYGTLIPTGRTFDEAQLHLSDPNTFHGAYNLNYHPGAPTTTDPDEFSTIGFVDRTNYLRPTTFINQQMENGGTAQHEATHLASNPDFRTAVPHDLNEGVTEYFTHQFTDPAHVDRSSVQYNDDGSAQLAGTVARIVGHDTLAQAYFGAGNAPVQALANALDAHTFPGCNDIYLQMVREGHTRAAQALLELAEH